MKLASEKTVIFYSAKNLVNRIGKVYKHESGDWIPVSFYDAKHPMNLHPEVTFKDAAKTLADIVGDEIYYDSAKRSGKEKKMKKQTKSDLKQIKAVTLAFADKGMGKRIGRVVKSDQGRYVAYYRGRGVSHRGDIESAVKDIADAHGTAVWVRDSMRASA